MVVFTLMAGGRLQWYLFFIQDCWGFLTPNSCWHESYGNVAYHMISPKKSSGPHWRLFNLYCFSNKLHIDSHYQKMFSRNHFWISLKLFSWTINPSFSQARSGWNSIKNSSRFSEEPWMIFWEHFWYGRKFKREKIDCI